MPDERDGNGNGDGQPAEPAQVQPEKPNKNRQRREREKAKFQPDDFVYDLAEFISPGKDDNGMSIRLFFRCAPILERDLEILRDSKRFPYKTVSDIIRHAVTRHVQWLHRLEEDIPRHYMIGMEAVMEVMRDAEIRGQMAATFQRLDQMVDSALGSGDGQEAMRLMTATRSKVAALPDSRWKRQWLDKFSSKYGKYFGMGPVQQPLPDPDPDPDRDQDPEGGDGDGI